MILPSTSGDTVVPTARGVGGRLILASRTTDAAKYSTTTRQRAPLPPTTKNYPDQNVNRTEVEENPVPE